MAYTVPNVMMGASANTLVKMLIAGTLAATLSSCGGGSSSGSDAAGGRGGSGNGFLTLKLTDAVIDSISEVWVVISSVEIKPADGPSVTHVPPGAPVAINLLSLQGGAFYTLFDSLELASGEYNWIRLHITAEIDTVWDSYVVLDDSSMHELRIPSGNQTGLQINNPMVLGSNEMATKIIDFDLRKSVVYTSGEYLLKPVLRFIDEDSGTISGNVSATDLSSVINCSDTDPDTYNAVYIFEGFDVTPDDIKGNPSDPYTSASIILNPATGLHEYTAAYIPYGNYTVAYTCQSDLDDPEVNDSIVFFGTHNLTVSEDIIIVR